MIGAEQGDAVGWSARQVVFGSVSEGVEAAARDDAGGEEVGEVAVPGDLAQADNDAETWEGGDFGSKMGTAVAELVGLGFICGRGAADHGRDVSMAQLKAVFAVRGEGLGGEAEGVQDGVHEVTGAVAGKGAASAVGPMSAGGEAKDEDAGAGGAEAGHGTSPVGLVEVGAATGLADSRAILAKAGTAAAGGDVLVDDRKRVGGRTDDAGHCCRSYLELARTRMPSGRRPGSAKRDSAPGPVAGHLRVRVSCRRGKGD